MVKDLALGSIIERHDKKITEQTMDVGKKIKQLRKEKGWSQAEFGKKIGVHPQYVSAWETGDKVPSAEALVKLSQILDVSTDYLLLDNVPREGTHTIDDFGLYELFRQAEVLPQEERKAIEQVVSGLVFRNKVRQADEEEKPKPQPVPLRKVAGRR